MLKARRIFLDASTTYAERKGKRKNTEVDVEKFNEFFVKIGKQLASKCSPVNSNINSDNDGLGQTFVLFNTDAKEVFNIISNLKNKSSCGHDGTSNKILKLAASSVSAFLAEVFIDCILTSQVPKSVKTAEVIPLLKKGDISLPDSYRSISLLISLSKVFEKLIYKRITKFLVKHKLLSPNQFGFRQNLSCINAIAEITEFAKIDNLLRDYLSERDQEVFSGGKMSSFRRIECGVPQGSILGPLFFLIYINDLPKTCQKSGVVLFADDTALVTSKTNVSVRSNLESDLEKMNIWFSNNKMTVSVAKCSILPFGKPLSKIEVNTFNGLAGDMQIIDKFRYLGVSIDKRLNFNSHVASVQKHLAKFNGLLFKARYCFSRKVLLRFYEAYAKPIISYGLLIYGCTRESVLKQIHLMQKRIMRKLFFKKREESVSELFFKHKISTIYELYLEEFFKETIYQVYGWSTIKSQDFENQTLQRFTRSHCAGLLRPHFYRVTTGTYSLSNRITKCFNFLMKNDLLPKFGKSVDKTSLKRFILNFKKLYIQDSETTFNLIFG